jgi:hypothetical protein
VDFRTNTPLLGVDVEPVAGWTAKVSEVSLNPPVQTDDGPVAQVVSQIVWTAAPGGGTPPGQFQEFDVLVQQLPTGTDQAVLKALQTNSDGTIVRWIDPVTADHPDPDHPTPILKLTPAGASTGAGAGAVAGATSTTPSSTVPSPSSQAFEASGVATTGAVSSARTIGVIGLVVGALGLIVAVVAVVAVVRRREGGGPAPTGG